MSSVTEAAPAANTKRPLDDETCPTGPAGQPDAKRPALDKVSTDAGGQLANGHASSDAEAGAVAKTETSSTAQPIKSGLGDASPPHADESSWLHLRAVITTAEASTIIGKGGDNVSQIRRSSGVKCNISDYSRGIIERVMTISGTVDAVAKAFGLIVRTLNNEPMEAASTAQSKTYALRLLVPHFLVGAIIGKGGVRIREIAEASGARLNASETCLPLSTERSLVVLGVADAVHIASYYVGQTLVEQLTERFGGPAASAYATRAGGPAGVVPGGMQVIPYIPMPAGGQYGHPDTLRRSANPMHKFQHSQGMPYSGPQPGGFQPQQAMPTAMGSSAQPQPGGQPGQQLTQQIFIPNDMVGAIIGKGGTKINEIRQLSGSVIKINEPQDNSNERMVTISGTSESNQMALYMLYSRLESEKHRM